MYDEQREYLVYRRAIINHNNLITKGLRCVVNPFFMKGGIGNFPHYTERTEKNREWRIFTGIRVVNRTY